MKVGEENREHDRRRPEPDGLGESEQGVTAQVELFGKTHHQEIHRPEAGKFQNPRSVQNQPVHLESPRAMQDEQQDGQRTEPPSCSHPEQLPECLARGQTVHAKRTLLEPRQQECGSHGHDQHHKLDDQVRPQGKHFSSTAVHHNSQQQEQALADGQIQQEPPSRAQPILADERVVEVALKPRPRLRWDKDGCPFPVGLPGVSESAFSSFARGSLIIFCRFAAARKFPEPSRT